MFRFLISVGTQTHCCDQMVREASVCAIMRREAGMEWVYEKIHRKKLDSICKKTHLRSFSLKGSRKNGTVTEGRFGV